ncbi:MAG: CtpF protein, partial [Bradyrhizobium sp.]|nr:CtpF protein [Bradyrhizobium sp.]
MSSQARQQSDEQPNLLAPHADDYIAPAPRVSVQAFCESVATAIAVTAAAEDRRLA